MTARQVPAGPSSGSAVLRVIVAAGTVSAGLALVSLRWPLVQDLPILYYTSFLANEHGLVPYRDIFDMNMPGAHAAYSAITALVGYSAPAARVVDLVCLTALLLVTWRLMRWTGRRAAWAAVALFALLYLAAGAAMSLQREFLLLLPVAAAAMLLHEERLPVALRAVLSGALLGVATTIKPHAIVAGPVLLGVLLRDAEEGRRPVRSRLALASIWVVGLTAPIGLVCAWLWSAGALGAFVDIVTQYWPLYTSLTGAPPYRVVSGVERVRELAGGYATLVTTKRLAWTLAAVLGSTMVVRGLARGHRVSGRLWLVPGLTLAFSFYPVVAGKFWHYHWLPFGYFAALTCALAVADRARGWSGPGAWVLVLFCLGMPWPRADVDPHNALRLVHAREIADQLIAGLRPGETVQALDWTGVALHAMLLARAPAATPFLEDVHFHHHVSHPYIRGLRERFLSDLTRAAPRFVIEVEQAGWDTQPETAREFPALQAWLAGSYRVTLERPGLRVHERVERTRVSSASRREASIASR